MTDDPGWGGCIGVLLTVILAAFFFYVVAGYLVPWLQYKDRIASVCPTSGVATVVTHYTLGGSDWTVTCVNDDRWHVSNGGKVKALP